MSETIKTFIIKYDDSAAFGNCLFKIKEPNIPDGFTVQRLAVQIGPLTKVYDGQELQYPIPVQVTREESMSLEHENPVDILLYDGNGNAQTAVMKNRYVVVCGERRVFDDGGNDSD